MNAIDLDRSGNSSFSQVRDAISTFLQDPASPRSALLFAVVRAISTHQKQQVCLLLERLLHPIASLRTEEISDPSLRLRRIQLQGYIRIWLHCYDDADGTFKKRYARRFATKKRRKAMSFDDILMADVYSIFSSAAFCLQKEESLPSFLRQVLPQLADNISSADQDSMRALIQRIFSHFEVPFRGSSDSPSSGSSGLLEVGLSHDRSRSPVQRADLDVKGTRTAARRELAPRQTAPRTTGLVNKVNRSQLAAGRRFHSSTNTSKKWRQRVEDLMSLDQFSRVAVPDVVAPQPQVAVLETAQNRRALEDPRGPTCDSVRTENATPRKRAGPIVFETPIPCKKANMRMR
jgi:hypothetical protein